MKFIRITCVLTVLSMLGACAAYHPSDSVTVYKMCAPDVVKVAMEF